MAVGIATTEANEALDAWLVTYTWVKLHIGDPGAAGAGAPALNTTRQQATWGAAAGGVKSNTNILEWLSVPNSEDYTHISFWTASTAGTFGGSALVTANPVTTGDTFRIAAGDIDVTVTGIAA